MNNDIINHINKGQVFAIIPARSGSKGIKDKNIRLLNGYPMIGYTIAAAKLTKGIDRVIVSTDSERYAEIAKTYGAETPFLRPSELATDTSTDLEFMQHAINWFYENEGSVPEYWVHLRPTTPFRDHSVIEAAIDKFKIDESSDSLRSAHLSELCPFKWFTLTGNGYYETFNGISFDDANKPRQDFRDTYIPDGYVDLLRTSCIVKNNSVHGNKMMGFISPNSIDVDSENDFHALEKSVSSYQSDVLEYLNKMQGGMR